MIGTKHWRQRFSDYCVEERIAELLRLNIPDHLITLVENDLTDLSGHAASGWLREIGDLTKAHSDPERARGVAHPDMESVLPYARPLFSCRADWLLVGRDEAAHLLVEEARVRRRWDAPLSPFRYLTRFRWPQSVLFPALPRYQASPEQLYHFVRSKWPVGDEDDFLHRAVAECLRYGVPTGFAGDVRFTV